MPNTSFIGFTGTPVELDDKSTPAVFGDYIDKYDILQAVEDGATVAIVVSSASVAAGGVKESTVIAGPE